MSQLSSQTGPVILDDGLTAITFPSLKLVPPTKVTGPESKFKIIEN